MAESTEGIKQLPQRWRWVRLEEVCKINPVRPNDLKRAPNALITFIPMTAVDDREGKIIHAEIRPYSEVASGYTYFEEGDVLFAKITPCMQNGKHVIATGLTDGIGFGSTEFHIIRPGETITSEWVHRYIRQPVVLNEAKTNFTGSVGQQRVPKSFLASLEIPLPPIEEQRRIIKIVNEQMAAVKKARTAGEARLEAAKALANSYLREVFTGPEVEIKSLASPEPGSFKIGPFGSSLKKEQLVSAGIPVVGIENILPNKFFPSFHRFITKEKFSQLSQYQMRPADILVTTMGTIGRAAVVPDNIETMIIDSHLFRMRVDQTKVLPAYLCYGINGYLGIKNQLVQMASGAIMAGLNTKILKECTIPLPSITEQKTIVAFLSEKMAAVEKMMQALAQELEAISTLSSSLLRKAFSGGL